MTTVTGKLIGAASPARVEMLATLVDVTGTPAVGYVASVPGELVRPVAITPETDGDWSVSLTANALIDSQAGDTLWAIQEGRAKDGTPIITYVVVPETGGPYWIGDIRADLSITLLGDSSVVYLAGPEGPAGPAGADGAPGAAGADGDDGASAYELAVAEGFTGTQTEWLASLVGPQGEPGDPANIDAHAADTTDVHGIADTAALETQAGAQAKADTAETEAVNTANQWLGLHQSDTTDIHGIPNTALLETTPGAQAKADAAQTAATTAAATDATGKVTTHTGAVDPHGDRAYADSKLAKASNLADLPSASTARGNLGLGGAATLAVGTGPGTVAAGDDSRITGALQATGGAISGNLAVTGHALGEDTPAAHGVAAWCYDPALAVNSTQLAAGTLYLVGVNIAANVSATKIYWWVANTGSSAVAGQNLVGLYDASGALLASANVDAAFSSATLKTTTVPATALSAGSFYWVALLFNASVPPTLTRASGWTGVNAAANLGLTAATYRFATNGTGRTALPSSLTLASNVGTDFAGPWAAVGA